MAYERQTWETGTVIPESKLLHIENGIYDVTETADQNAEDIEQNTSDIKQNTTDIASLNSALAAISTSSFQQTNITVAYNYGYTDVEFSVSRSGYTPLGVVGWYLANSSTDGSGSTRIYLSRLRLSGTTVQARLVCTAGSTDAKVDMTVYVLYKAA